MSYDAADRLSTSIQGTTTTTFTFDGTGNRIGENNNGSLTTYMFDNENRLKTLTQSSNQVITNTCDGSGVRRTTQQQGGTVHTMVWDGSDYLGEVH